MRPFRKNVALAIDGGGIRGIMVTRALSILEEHLSQPIRDICNLAAGTSTGSIISAGIASGSSVGDIHRLYLQLGKKVFRKRLRTYLWFLSRHRYPNAPLQEALQDAYGNKALGDFWKPGTELDLVITLRDLVENRTRFLKPWKDEYRQWPVWKAVLASSAVPTYFPVVDGRYVDGGIGSYSNPCYVAAYEAVFCLGWKPEDTTLISIGTGRIRSTIKKGRASKFRPWRWINPLIDAFLSDANDQQVHVVHQFFKKMDFRRFQIDIEDIGMDDASKMELLTDYGTHLGEMILSDRIDEAPLAGPEMPH